MILKATQTRYKKGTARGGQWKPKGVPDGTPKKIAQAMLASRKATSLRIKLLRMKKTGQGSSDAYNRLLKSQKNLNDKAKQLRKTAKTMGYSVGSGGKLTSQPKQAPKAQTPPSAKPKQSSKPKKTPPATKQAPPKQQKPPVLSGPWKDSSAKPKNLSDVYKNLSDSPNKKMADALKGKADKTELDFRQDFDKMKNTSFIQRGSKRNPNPPISQNGPKLLKQMDENNQIYDAIISGSQVKTQDILQEKRARNVSRATNGVLEVDSKDISKYPAFTSVKEGQAFYDALKIKRDGYDATYQKNKGMAEKEIKDLMENDPTNYRNAPIQHAYKTGKFLAKKLEYETAMGEVVKEMVVSLGYDPSTGKTGKPLDPSIKTNLSNLEKASKNKLEQDFGVPKTISLPKVDGFSEYGDLRAINKHYLDLVSTKKKLTKPEFQFIDSEILRTKKAIKKLEKTGITTKPAKMTGDDWKTKKLPDMSKLSYSTKADGSPGDGKMEALVKMQGFNGGAKVVDKKAMDGHIANGAIELRRSINASPVPINGKIKTGKDFSKEFKSPDPSTYHPGYGSFGSGTYTGVTSDQKSINYVESFYSGTLSSGTSSTSAMLRMALKPDARVVKIDDLYSEGYNLSSAEKKKLGISSAGVSSSDISNLAVAKGYDAIDLTGNQVSAPTYYNGYVILNRTALFVQDKDIK